MGIGTNYLPIVCAMIIMANRPDGRFIPPSGFLIRG
jgi:hypothetical protein